MAGGIFSSSSMFLRAGFRCLRIRSRNCVVFEFLGVLRTMLQIRKKVSETKIDPHQSPTGYYIQHLQ